MFKLAGLALIASSLTNLVFATPPIEPSYRQTNSLKDNRAVPKCVAIATDGYHVVLTRSNEAAEGGKGWEFPRGKANTDDKCSRDTADRELKEETGYIGRARSSHPAGIRVRVTDKKTKERVWLNCHVVEIHGHDPTPTKELANRQSMLVPFAQVETYLTRPEMKKLWDKAYDHVCDGTFETEPHEVGQRHLSVHDDDWIEA